VIGGKLFTRLPCAVGAIALICYSVGLLWALGPTWAPYRGASVTIATISYLKGGPRADRHLYLENTHTFYRIPEMQHTA
jgi:hypothetical protein